MWRHRWVRWAGATLAVMVTATVMAAAVLLVATPSVADADRRAAAAQRDDHAGQPVAHVPVRIAQAVLAVEDHRFFRHPGVDALALVRSGAGAVRGRDEGGSTIELQLAKLLYTGDGREPTDAVDRLGIAVKLDARYGKKRVLLMYLNTVYFGHGYYGVAAAARGYFGRSPDDLDWSQAALLAGLLKAPDGYDPVVHPQAATARRAHVLDRLVAVGVLSRARADAYADAPLGLATSRSG